MQEFPYASDTVYVSHCYPYTYTDLLSDLDALVGDAGGAATNPAGRALCVRREALCETLAGNTCFLVSIDDPRAPSDSRRGSLRSTAAATPPVTVSSTDLSDTRRNSLEKANGHSASSFFPTSGPEQCHYPSQQLSSDPRDLNKRVIVVTARVHPGETNSSWMMKGLLEFLASPNYIAQVNVLINVQ